MTRIGGICEPRLKVFLSSIGSRGDIEPILALAFELQAMGHRAVLCVMPHFKSWIESHGVDCVALEVPKGANTRQLFKDMVRVQFQATLAAARDCNLIIGFGPQPFAGRSIAEHLGIAYVYATYSPCLLPSPDHPPPKMRQATASTLPRCVNRLLWWLDSANWNKSFRPAINQARDALALPPIANVAHHMRTDAPWLAADQVLGPGAAGCVQTGAWLLDNPAPLPAAVEHFLSGGDPPVYLGFGSMPIAGQTARLLAQAARAAGFRAIVRCGLDSGTDVIAVGDVNHQKLFPRVAAIVHHGGGTTTNAARAGKPQIVIPHAYDMFYWARRMEHLGVGLPLSLGSLTVDALSAAIAECVKPQMTAAAAALAPRVELRGARIAAERLVEQFD
jgi:vancomycin aglycone glucosyltransferase